MYNPQLVAHKALSQRVDDARVTARDAGQAPGFRASGLADCLRQPGYRLLGHEEQKAGNANWDMAAEQGNTIHKIMQRNMRRAGLVLDYPQWGPALELPLHKCCNEQDLAWLHQYGFSGHIDAVLRLPATGELAIVDIKTVESKLVNDLSPKLQSNLQKYATQINAYLHFFVTPQGEKATRGIVLVVSRDNTKDRLRYDLAYDAGLWDAERSRVEAAYDAVRRGELPAAEPERGCFFCGFKHLCDGYRERALPDDGAPGLVKVVRKAAG